MEKGIEKEDCLRLNRRRVKQNRLTPLMIKTVRVKGWLYHDKRVAHVFMIEHVAIKGCLVWRIIEDLQKLASAQVKHELRVKGEILLQPRYKQHTLAVDFLDDCRTMADLNDEGSSFLYSANLEQSRMSIRSTHLSTSGPSSTSALNTAILDIKTYGTY